MLHSNPDPVETKLLDDDGSSDPAPIEPGFLVAIAVAFLVLIAAAFVG